MYFLIVLTGIYILLLKFSVDHKLNLFDKTNYSVVILMLSIRIAVS